MSTWIVQVVVVALFALTCGALAARGCAGGSEWPRSCSSWSRSSSGSSRSSRSRRSSAMRTTSRRATTTARRALRLRGRLHRAAAAHRARGARDARAAGAAGARGRRRTRITGSGELVQASRPRRGPHGGRGRALARREGQEIAEDDPLVEIQTDKATVEIPSPYAGTVLRILVAEGESRPSAPSSS